MEDRPLAAPQRRIEDLEAGDAGPPMEDRPPAAPQRRIEDLEAGDAGPPMEDRPPLRFARYRDRAQELVRSGEALGKLAGKATRKLARRLPTRFQAAQGELATFAALLKAWAQGDYRQVSVRTLVAITAAVLYFVTPFDLVPDFLAVLGLLDDAAVVGYVVRAFRQEIACFERWREGRGEEP